MSALIDRDKVIEIIESVCSADDTYWQPGTLEKIRNLPTHKTPSNTLGALDCVERQAAIDNLERYRELFSWDDGDRERAILSRVIKELQSMPSVQPRKGKWINIQYSVTGDSNAECDQCGAIVHDNFLLSPINFCPNCGADMRPQAEEPTINPCRGCPDYIAPDGCRSSGGCADMREGDA